MIVNHTLNEKDTPVFKALSIRLSLYTKQKYYMGIKLQVVLAYSCQTVT